MYLPGSSLVRPKEVYRSIPFVLLRVTADENTSIGRKPTFLGVGGMVFLGESQGCGLVSSHTASHEVDFSFHLMMLMDHWFG